MKKYLSTAILILCTTIAFAQKLVIPEYNGQSAIVNSDSTTTLLPKESSSMKAKSSWMSHVPVPVPGKELLDKTKVNINIPGAESSVSVPKGDITLIYRIGDNNNDPKTLIQITKFEVKKKARQYTYANASLLQGVNMKGIESNVEWTAHKYGDNCYLINIKNADEGQYGIIFASDIKNISTFGVK